MKRLIKLIPHAGRRLEEGIQSFNAEVIHRHVPVVIGMKGLVSDDNARLFSAGFYEGLATGMQAV